jgi:predicted PurR-regulated permease PerM
MADSARDFTIKTLIVAGVAIALIGLWLLQTVLLLFFVAVLFAILLYLPSNYISLKTSLSYRFSLVLVIILLVLVFLIGGGVLGVALADQFENIVVQIEGAWANLQTVMPPALLEPIEDANLSIRQLLTGTAIFDRATDFLTSAIGVFAGLVLTFFTAIYLALDPKSYKENFIRLIPTSNRKRAEEIINLIGGRLSAWLGGQLLLGLVVGIITTIGLTIIGVPNALALGFLAGVFELVPIFGPILAAIPAIIIAFIEAPILALYTLIFYYILQQVESYVLLPVVYKHTISLSPVASLFTIIVAGTLFGPLGIFLAAPLLLVFSTLLFEIYVKQMEKPSN